ncbi:MAG: hypothetical protein MZV63_20680 [Marinilabiliales bacterium]|nr:hypothetical protein [Marinilabiliales bacterium]
MRQELLLQDAQVSRLSGRKASVTSDQAEKGSGVLKLSFRPYELQLRHVFTVATNSRTTTPVVLTTIEYDGITGFGEASMPPYLGESHRVGD